MTYRGDWANAPTTERRRETRAKNGFYTKPRKVGRVSKSDEAWKRLRHKADGRAFANRSDAVRGF